MFGSNSAYDEIVYRFGQIRKNFEVKQQNDSREVIEMVGNRRCTQTSKNGRSDVRNMTFRQNNIAQPFGRGVQIPKSRKQREQLVLTHLPLIRFIAHRIAMRLPKWIDSNDLINTGVLGLLDAASKFDSAFNVQFKTYAELRIRGAILDSLRRLDWAPRSLRQKERLLEHTTGELTKKLGREAEDREVARAMGLKLAGYQRMVNEVKGLSFGHFQPVVNNETEGGEARDTIEFVPAGENTDPHLICERSEWRRVLGGLIGSLPRKERLVVSLYYYEELSMKEIGKVLHVNESRVSQLRNKAMFLLRRRLKNAVPEMRGV
jgi:RNA polymerase sigma factor FliA